MMAPGFVRVPLIPRPMLLTIFLDSRMLPGTFLDVKHSYVTNSSFIQNYSLAQILFFPVSVQLTNEVNARGHLLVPYLFLGLGPRTRGIHLSSQLSCLHRLHLHQDISPLSLFPYSQQFSLGLSCCPLPCSLPLGSAPCLLTQVSPVLNQQGTKMQSLMKQSLPVHRGLVCNQENQRYSAPPGRERSCQSVPTLLFLRDGSWVLTWVTHRQYL